MNTDLFYKLLVFRFKGIGAIKYHELIGACGSAEAAVESLQISGDAVDAVKREMELSDKNGIRYITDDSPEFSEMYKKVRNHSPILAVRGNVNTLKTVGIVGTRHVTASGMMFTSNLAHEFSCRGYAVVSGMAIGTDTAAHSGALIDSGDSVTIAVLAGGVDYIWPLENEKLYHNICERGLIVSDMPTGFVPVANNFIARNRIIAGISEMLILGEADANSGSVSTANFALENKRPLWAIPSHPSDERSQGPNLFIQSNKAKLCMGPSDFFPDQKLIVNKKNKLGSELLDLIGSTPVSESVLTSLVKKSISETMSELVMLELNGFIKKSDGGYVRV